MPVMASAWLAAGLVVAAGAISLLGTRVLIPLLGRAAVLDLPNERSSHARATPRGGGLAVVAAIVVTWAAVVVAGFAPPRLTWVIACAVLLAAVSWLDDLRGLSPAPRLLAQIVAVALGCAALAPAWTTAPGWLPGPITAGAALVLWVWFANLFNFMDGIDGIAASEAAAIGIGLVLFAAFGIGHDPARAVLAAVVAAAALGFLVWNWAPARIFLGDVGSVPVGYLLGYLLLDAAARGFWKLAVILPLYFLADATITLIRRLVRGEAVWRPHRQHFYQVAVQNGRSHAAVVLMVIAADAVLIGLGWAAENAWGVLAIAPATATVLLLLYGLVAPGRRR